MDIDVASKVPFSQLCALLDKISNRSGTDAKKKLLKEFMRKWRDFHNKLHKDGENTVRVTTCGGFLRHLYSTLKLLPVF